MGFETGTAEKLELMVGDKVFIPQRIMRIRVPGGEFCGGGFNYGNVFQVEIVGFDETGQTIIRYLDNSTVLYLKQKRELLKERIDGEVGSERSMPRNYSCFARPL